MEDHCRACGRLVEEHKEQESLNCSREILEFDQDYWERKERAESLFNHILEEHWEKE